MAVYEIEYRGIDAPGVRLKTAIVVAPNATAALDDIAHLIRPEDGRAYKVRRINPAARGILYSSDEY